MKLYDISHTINKDLKVWPGDRSFDRTCSMSISEGDSCNVSSMQASMHTGTHVDAHFHYAAEGISMEKHNLENYIGSCQVIHVMDVKGKSIKPSDIKVDICEKRIILRTKQTNNGQVWDSDFKSISLELVDLFHDKGVILVGTDAASVDLFDSTTMQTHKAFYQYDIYNLESLKLDGIQEGVYKLIALPLKIEGSDGSPVRAVLIEGDI